MDGASFADLAVILVDATQGVLVQTKRHARICALMGIKHFVLAVNKMDLIGYDQHRFDEIKDEFGIGMRDNGQVGIGSFGLLFTEFDIQLVTLLLFAHDGFLSDRFTFPG